MVSPPVQEDVSAVKEVTGVGDLQGLEFVCDHEGYRYYKNTETGKQCCLDSTGHWFLFDENNGTFIPMNDANKSSATPKPKEDKGDPRLRNVERFGIKFDHNGRPIFPKNERGLFILPKDEKRLPFFPVDEKARPIFPYDYTKGESAFPVDDTDEPIFPRNAHNKPIVPNDKNGQPLFPKDVSGNFIFPLNENNCPIPALTLEGLPVVPKDAYGNFVIPQDRDGNPLIHIASDGVTPVSAAEWKQWKKFYRDQARTFYKQQQLHMAVQNVPRSSANHSITNSMFHPVNLEQQSVFFAADMQMLQMTRRVRPEDVDLPAAEDIQQPMEFSADVGKNGEASMDPKQLKRKKFIEAQLKSIKKPLSPKIEVKKSKKEVKAGKERKKNKTKESSRRNKKKNRSRKRRRSSTRSRSTSRDTLEMVSRGKRNEKKHSRSSRSSSQRSESSVTSRSTQASSFTSENKEEEERLRKRLLSKTIPANESVKDMKLEAEEYGPKPPAVLKGGSSDMELSDEERRAEEAVLQQPKLEIVEEMSSTSIGKNIQNCKPVMGPFNVKEVLESGHIDLIKSCKEQERESYDQLKLKIAELLVEKSIHKLNLVKLREAEKRIEGCDADKVSVSSDVGV
ncbi:unnamed protein product [Meloidogyne enterolobii]|uniref:Uncharacterized protein n=1 Tax=Meloidogyne enterolobii TaxID=390850 RepID=A0ACB0ZFI6_MELEN